MPEMIAVSSSNVAAVGYQPATRILTVRFVGGAVYEYARVPASVHADLLGAASKGGYLAKSIKGRYAVRRV